MKFHELHITPNNSLQKALNHSEWHSKLRTTTRWQRVFQLACIHVQSKSQINQQVGIVLQWRLWWQIEGTGRGRHLSFNIQGVQVSTLPESNFFCTRKTEKLGLENEFPFGARPPARCYVSFWKCRCLSLKDTHLQSIFKPWCLSTNKILQLEPL